MTTSFGFRECIISLTKMNGGALFDNCSFRVSCGEAGATGGDSDCKVKG